MKQKILTVLDDLFKMRIRQVIPNVFYFIAIFLISSIIFDAQNILLSETYTSLDIAFLIASVNIFCWIIVFYLLFNKQVGIFLVSSMFSIFAGLSIVNIYFTTSLWLFFASIPMILIYSYFRYKDEEVS